MDIEDDLPSLRRLGQSLVVHDPKVGDRMLSGQEVVQELDQDVFVYFPTEYVLEAEIGEELALCASIGMGLCLYRCGLIRISA